MIKNLSPATGLTGLHKRQPHLVTAGEFPGYVTLPALKAALNDEDPGVRIMVNKAIEYISAQESEE